MRQAMEMPTRIRSTSTAAAAVWIIFSSTRMARIMPFLINIPRVSEKFRVEEFKVLKLEVEVETSKEVG